ncbi:hypothetical protein SAMD00019534_080980 [Acytostelium subglobosum LB1]|uniref:hypothetical protein n=1 Tax=Acytostelium subglobosum LB1 TaxID=1410327 RepID=UPI00064519E5|nr:hypothetical protein SAMD00019534_080980 [Acytostelium subglobosum LB1]GAM24923.1 hypothetical protein SAMD00019534_080980 [Acytostelium subglobosum LB1]|eukprot:XP_012752012.1 hypothetical protein SAMD00019534_080980 [Acytostelium subglobosum LB1]
MRFDKDVNKDHFGPKTNWNQDANNKDKCINEELNLKKAIRPEYESMGSKTGGIYWENKGRLIEQLERCRSSSR